MSTVRQDPEAQAVDEARQQIRSLVQEVEQLSKSDISPAEFYEGFLQRVISALAAVGGAVWTLGDDGRLGLTYQSNLLETGLVESEERQQQHGKLLTKVMASNEAILVPPQSAGEDGAGNPTNYLLVVSPLKSDKEVKGIVEVFQRTGGRPAVERGYLRFLAQMCEIASIYLQTRSLRHFSTRQTLWSQLETFTRNVHQTLDPRLTAYTIANDGRRLIECDRVTVAISNGRKCKVEAVSGQEIFDKRSNVVTLLNQLATAAAATGEPVWYTGDTTDMAPQVEQAIQAYIDESHSKAVAVLPLKRPLQEGQDEKEPQEAIGALIVEQIEESQLPEGFRHRVDVVTQHSATALANAMEHQNLFLMPVWKTLGRASWVVRARTLPKTLAVVGTILLILAALCLVPGDFDLEGRGTLEPVVKRDVFAAVDGVVEELLVQHGDMVQAGQQVARLRNFDLESELERVLGEISTTQQREQAARRVLSSGQSRTTAAERATAEGDLASYQQTLRTLRTQQKLLEDKLEQLTVRSPIAGQVVTWELREKLLARPVEKGQVLVTVADPTQDWELQVQMPENRMGHIAAARKDLGDPLHVSYILATSPGITREGTVKQIHGMAEVRGEEGNTVMVKVTIDQPDLAERRPGVTTTAKVHCGRRAIGYVWLHDLIAFVQKTWFRVF